MQKLAHDLRQFITVIAGNCDLIERRVGDQAEAASVVACAVPGAAGDLPAEIRRYVLRRTEIIREAASNMEAMIGEFLRASALTTADGRPDPNKIATALHDLLSGSSPHIAVALDLDPAAPPLAEIASPIMIYRALLNLCSNSRHAILDLIPGIYEGAENAPGVVGTMTIGTRLRQGYGVAGPPISSPIRSCAEVSIFVSDTGPGMSAEQLARVMERMNGAPALGEHGHGLQIVKAAVDKLGGRMEVTSVVGVGTTVTLVLPAGGEGAREGENVQRPMLN